TLDEAEAVRAESVVRLGAQEAAAAAAAGAALPMEEAIAAVLTPLSCARFAREWDGPEHPLTQRETEVAELVAAGLTNREIARRLGIAEWTAVNHLRKIMRKLDCSSRVQVAGWMTRRAEALADPTP
ncbi:helix-turn-helix transcriptional regulator, partial [Streptomyces sp.]|uniref:helix-turn-helix transcriptional regulator n=1 Tax=Streptomyces sp. TaxID=1931 RepID=UPI002F92F5C9